MTVSSILSDVVVPLSSAIVGGFIAAGGAFVALRKQQTYERKNRQYEERKSRAEKALEAVFAVYADFEFAGNVRRNISEQFERANAEGQIELEPWQKVLGMVHAKFHQKTVLVSDISFLIDAKKAELINDVHLVQSRIQHLAEAVETYNQQRADLMVLMEAKHKDGTVKAGNLVEASFDATDAFVINARAGALQSTLGTVLEFLETDVDEAWRVMLALKQAAEDCFESDFPSFKMERSDSC